METEYKVRLEVFEGPLDLLLYLIKRDEIDIYDISLERITQQYLEYLQAFKELNIDVAGEFVVMAANLIYLKSRSLLPVDQQPPEEDVEEDDPRWDLIRQLIEYKKFKEAAAQLQTREVEQERIFARVGDSIAPEIAPLSSRRSGNFPADQRFSTGHQASRNTRKFTGNFWREFYRFGQDRTHPANDGEGQADQIFRTFRADGFAGRSRRHFSRAPRIDPIETGAGNPA